MKKETGKNALPALSGRLSGTLSSFRLVRDSNCTSNNVAQTRTWLFQTPPLTGKYSSGKFIPFSASKYLRMPWIPSSHFRLSNSVRHSTVCMLAAADSTHSKSRYRIDILVSHSALLYLPRKLCNWMEILRQPNKYVDDRSLRSVVVGKLTTTSGCGMKLKREHWK